MKRLLLIIMALVILFTLAIPAIVVGATGEESTETEVEEEVAAEPPVITTKSLPTAYMEHEYYVKLDCTDPAAEFSEYYDPGKDNEFEETGFWLLKDGTISGEPNREGEFTFTVCAVGEGGEGYMTYTLLVEEDPDYAGDSVEEPDEEYYGDDPGYDQVEPTKTPEAKPEQKPEAKPEDATTTAAPAVDAPAPEEPAGENEEPENQILVEQNESDKTVGVTDEPHTDVLAGAVEDSETAEEIADEENSGDDLVWLWIVIGVLLVVGAAVIVIVLIRKNKAK